jgi:phospholipid-binding lipoprotein MlaA
MFQIRAFISLAVITAFGLGGCATAQNPDPLEPVNRKIFSFNEGLDKVVLKPVATAYKTVLPQPVRNGVSNFFSNVTDPWSAVNLLLQGRVRDSISDFGRFATNSTVGVLGFMDVATDLGMPRHHEDFGRTLGHWGVEPGAYLVLPLLGPSDLRDTAALPVDHFGQLEYYVDNIRVRNSLLAVRIVSARANLLQAGALFDEMALDKYTFLRDFYLQRRRSQIEGTEASAADDKAQDKADDAAKAAEEASAVPALK